MELGGKGAVTAHKALRTAEKLRTDANLYSKKARTEKNTVKRGRQSKHEN